MNKVEVIEDHPARESLTGKDLPFMVMVNGNILRNVRGVGRRFSTSIKAAIAGTKEVDRLRAVGKEAKHES